jgi:hypothetical protein
MTDPKTADPVLRRPVRLKPMKGGKRECWVTLLWDANERCEIVIGARTKAECIRQFLRISGGAEVIPKRVYRAVWSKAKP